MKCRFVKTVFYNEQNGYTVAVYATKENLPLSVISKLQIPGYRCFTAVGSYLPRNETVMVELRGEWKKEKYGVQFSVNESEEILPSTVEGIENYLGSGLLKGIGPSTAKRIVEKYGEETFDVLENHPEYLLDIPGITEDKLKTALECYEASRGIRDIVAFLTPFGVSPNKAVKIYRKYGSLAVKRVKENPYCLTEIHGFGFKTADAIAKHLGFAADNTLRVIEGTAHTVSELCAASGHLFVLLDNVVKSSLKLLNSGYPSNPVSEDDNARALYRLVSTERIVKESDRIYLYESYAAEKSTAERAAKFLKQPISLQGSEKMINSLENELHILLSMQQRQAVRQADLYDFSIITGGPGTGKTTILRFITQIYRRQHPFGKMKLMAPTALAARRMMESTGLEATTIHTAFGLGIDEMGKEKTENLEADFVIIDECSMIDQRLAAKMFARLKSGTKLLLLGDADQLPSIGAGNVFADFIASGVVPTTRLDTIFRQSAKSRIVSNAHAINKGSCALNFAFDDFRLLSCESSEEAAELVAEAYERALREHPNESVQVLTPMRKQSAAGSDMLNKKIQARVNPSRVGVAEVKCLGKLFREGDRVMHTRNSKKLSNGDIGKIASITPVEDGEICIKVDYPDDRHIVYKRSDLEDLTLAYAVTIHKSQGNQWDTVIIPMVMSFYRMLQRNLIYTAVTRAKSKVLLVGSKKAIFTAIKSNKCAARNTALASRLRNEFTKTGAEKSAA